MRKAESRVVGLLAIAVYSQSRVSFDDSDSDHVIPSHTHNSKRNHRLESSSADSLPAFAFS